jgi:hypothetical protein
VPNNALVRSARGDGFALLLRRYFRYLFLDAIKSPTHRSRSLTLSVRHCKNYVRHVMSAVHDNGSNYVVTEMDRYNTRQSSTRTHTTLPHCTHTHTTIVVLASTWLGDHQRRPTTPTYRRQNYTDILMEINETELITILADFRLIRSAVKEGADPHFAEKVID